jgi:hypothetical protein
MEGQEMEDRNRGPPEPAEGEADLESRLKASVTLDMSTMDFLVVAGWIYSSENLPDDDLFRALMKRRYLTRRGTLNRQTKSIETRAFIALKTHSRDVRTLRELKEQIERRGLADYRFGYHEFGYKTLAHFNEALNAYKIAAIKVGGGESPGRLRRYGLEPSDYRGA